MSRRTLLRRQAYNPPHDVRVEDCYFIALEFAVIVKTM